jgi:tetratricopeptide (TPR) repeat protein
MVDHRLGSLSPECVDDATLAAFVDGMLDPVSRGRVVAHIASCPDCSELVAEVIRDEEELQESSSTLVAAPIDVVANRPPSKPFWTGRAKLAATGGLFAVAASVLLLVLDRESQLASLVSIVGNERLTEARPTGGFQYGPLRSQVRSGSSQGQDRLALLAEEGRLRVKAASASPVDLHAWGVSQLLIGATADSVRTLESAANAAPNVAAHYSDLGAAYLTLFLEQRRATDGESALVSLDRALTLDAGSKEARFNKALLLGAMGRAADAADAWNQYLAVDADSRWAAEARRQRDALKRP